MTTVDHMAYVAEVSEDDVHTVIDKDASYRGSWKRRGGIGTYMMLARKWDRIEAQVERVLVLPPAADPEGTGTTVGVQKYDIFGHIEADTRKEGVLDDIRDLRQYLLLVEAEIRARRAQYDEPK